jgi:peptidoglycan-associated lipoprotein
MLRSPWLLLLALPLLGACDDPKKPEPKTGHDAAGAVQGPAPTKGDGDGDGDASKDEGETPVNIDERVAKMCDLPEARFEFDSSAIGPKARQVLDALATCFKTGPGKDHRLNIVGHADERGETNYNFGLGQKRAGAVVSYLTKAGLDETRVESSSRGELDATGHDDAGWARDRRVEILLAE